MFNTVANPKDSPKLTKTWIARSDALMKYLRNCPKYATISSRIRHVLRVTLQNPHNFHRSRPLENFSTVTLSSQTSTEPRSQPPQPVSISYIRKRPRQCEIQCFAGIWLEHRPQQITESCSVIRFPLQSAGSINCPHHFWSPQCPHRLYTVLKLRISGHFTQAYVHTSRVISHICLLPIAPPSPADGKGKWL